MLRGGTFIDGPGGETIDLGRPATWDTRARFITRQVRFDGGSSDGKLSVSEPPAANDFGHLTDTPGDG